MSIGKLYKKAKERIRQLEQQNAQRIADRDYIARQHANLRVVHSETRQELLRHKQFLDIEVFKDVEPSGHVKAAITLDPRIAGAINTEPVIHHVTQLVLEVANRRRP